MSSNIRIFKKHDSIKKLKKDLDLLKIPSIDFLKSEKERFYSSSMILFSMLNDLLSIAEEVVDILDFELPDNYHSIFKILSKNKVIMLEDEKICFKLVTLRNKLAHEYDDFTEEDIYELYKLSNYIVTLSNKLIEKV
jgi:uncharacterized protein YutE (UPF0331/DUF86 family)